MNTILDLPSRRAHQTMPVINELRSNVKRCPTIRACEDVVIERSRRPYGLLNESQWISVMYSCILSAHMVEDRTIELIEALKESGQYRMEVKKELNHLLKLTSRSSKQTYSILDMVESPEQLRKRQEYERRTGRRRKVAVGDHRDRAKMLYTLMTAEFDDQMENDIARMRAWCARYGNADFIMMIESCKIFFLVREAAKKLCAMKNIVFNHFDEMDQIRIEKSLMTIADKIGTDIGYQDKTIDTWKRTLGVKLAKWDFIKDLMRNGEKELEEMIRKGVIK